MKIRQLPALAKGLAGPRSSAAADEIFRPARGRDRGTRGLELRLTAFHARR